MLSKVRLEAGVIYTNIVPPATIIHSMEELTSESEVASIGP